VEKAFFIALMENEVIKEVENKGIRRQRAVKKNEKI